MLRCQNPLPIDHYYVENADQYYYGSTGYIYSLSLCVQFLCNTKTYGRDLGTK